MKLIENGWKLTEIDRKMKWIQISEFDKINENRKKGAINPPKIKKTIPFFSKKNK
jgi:hypothetical protein